MADGLNPDDGSRIAGVSLRGIVALILVLTICVMAVLQRQVLEPLYSLGIMAVGFYFGQTTKKT